MSGRKIIHVDMDAFYASVEQRDDLGLRGQPVVVAWRGPRSVVCAASYEARRFGIRSAMPALRAERLCPHAVFRPPDFPRYRAVSRQVRAILERYTDRIEPLSLDEAYLDVTTNKRGLPSATAVAQAIRQAIRDELQLTASAGVAPNKFLAKLASEWRKPDGLFVIRPEQVEQILSPLTVDKLPGVGKVTHQRLRALGLESVAELRTVDLRLLEQHFGRFGQRLYELAQGIDRSEVEVDRPAQSISAEDTFASDLTLEALAPQLPPLADKVWHASQQEGRSGRTVVLKLKTADFRVLTRSLTPPVPPSSASDIASIALSLRGRVHLPEQTRYRLVGVGLTNLLDLHPSELQPSLFA